MSIVGRWCSITDFFHKYDMENEYKVIRKSGDNMSVHLLSVHLSVPNNVDTMKDGKKVFSFKLSDGDDMGTDGMVEVIRFKKDGDEVIIYEKRDTEYDDMSKKKRTITGYLYETLSKCSDEGYHDFSFFDLFGHLYDKTVPVIIKENTEPEIFSTSKFHTREFRKNYDTFVPIRIRKDTRPYLGVKLKEDKDYLGIYGLEYGLRITEMDHSSNLYHACVKEDDVIISLKRVRCGKKYEMVNMNDLNRFLECVNEGEMIYIEYYRQGERRDSRFVMEYRMTYFRSFSELKLIERKK